MADELNMLAIQLDKVAYELYMLANEYELEAMRIKRSMSTQK